MSLGACSANRWQLVGVSPWEGPSFEENLTLEFLSYHPRFMGLTLASSGTENMCSTNWFDNSSLSNSFICSPCLINKSLLLAGSFILTWLKIFASMKNLLLRALISLLYVNSSLHHVCREHLSRLYWYDLHSGQN